ncbi:MAG: hypothetical protein ACM32O_17465 [Clostridia bacterium]
MKKAIALFSLLSLVLLVGCGSNQLQMKGLTNPKQLEKKKKPAALDNPGAHKQDMLLFLNRAERVVEDLHFAAASMENGKSVKEDDVTYRQLPKNLDTKEKIVTHFSRFWAKSIAEKMYNKLPTKLVKNKVYLAAQFPDKPMIIYSRNTSVQNTGKELVAVVSDATLPSLATERTVTYRLTKDAKTKKYKISKRSGAFKKELFD